MCGFQLFPKLKVTSEQSHLAHSEPGGPGLGRVGSVTAVEGDDACRGDTDHVK